MTPPLVRRTPTLMLLASGCFLLSACFYRVAPPHGEPVPVAIPRTDLPPRPFQVVFEWEYSDDSFRANGDGVARILPPDRVRLDFFLRNGNPGGMAILDGDSLYVPGGEAAQRFIPPPAMLWAAFNRLSLPRERDTAAFLDGDRLSVDLGTLNGTDARSASGRAWRVSFLGEQLTRVDRIEKKRVVESVVTDFGTGGKGVRYFHESAHRRLTIVATDTMWVEGFDADIWQRN